MDAAIARLSPALLSQWLHPERIIPDHVIFMSDRIREGISRGRWRGIICMPPGHAKSDTISVHTPLWFLEMFPSKSIALTSYGHEKAAEWGGKIRDVILQNPDKLTLSLKADSKARHRWHTPEGGGVYCTGVGGPLTGFRADFGIVDDPVKDREEANSQVYRERAWIWFHEVFLTRLNPDASAVLVHTRWHEDDLAGRLIRQGGWDLVSFPYFAEEGDVLGREPGAPLWPEYGFDREWGERQRAQIGSYSWASLYQQRPSPSEGAIFQRGQFRKFFEDGPDYVLMRPDAEPKRVPVSRCRRIQTCDTALEAKTTSDWTVCMTLVVTPDNELLVLDVARSRLEVPQQLGHLMAQRMRWNPDWQGVEQKGSGHGLIQAAANAGRPFRILKADTDKITRATPASIMYENGRVYHLEGAAWLEAFESELLMFPSGAHDDQVDCIAYAAREVGTRAPAVLWV